MSLPSTDPKFDWHEKGIWVAVHPEDGPDLQFVASTPWSCRAQVCNKVGREAGWTFKRLVEAPISEDQNPRFVALCALREAVRTKTEYWNAMGALEAAFGYDGGSIPDETSDALVNNVEDLAGGEADDMSWIDGSTLETFMENVGVTL